jgi:hypothetical protein
MSDFQEYLEQLQKTPWPANWNSERLDAMELSEEEISRDYEKMKRMYPKETRYIAAVIEDMCDRLEYEGSPMFDEQPDQITMYRMAEETYARIKGREAGPPAPDCALMQLSMIIICNEFHMRRCRYRQRKKRFW